MSEYKQKYCVTEQGIRLASSKSTQFGDLHVEINNLKFDDFVRIGQKQRDFHVFI